MKKVVLALLVLVFASAAQAGYTTLGGERFTCEFKTVTTVLNEGDTHCLHDWVEEPANHGVTVIAAVYCPCGCGDGGTAKICRKCLRKERTGMVGTAIPLEETEYERLNKRIKGN